MSETKGREKSEQILGAPREVILSPRYSEMLANPRAYIDRITGAKR